MDTSQSATSIHFKSVHSYSHINLYNAPVICAAMPNFVLTSGLNLVSAAQTNGINSLSNQESNINNLDALVTIQATNSLTSPSAAQLVPISSNGICSNNLQQIPLHQQTFIPDHCNNSKNIHLKTAIPLSQIQMTTTQPAIHNNNNNTDFNSNNNNNSNTNNDSEIPTGLHHHGTRASPSNNSNMLNNIPTKSVNKSDAMVARNDITMSIPKPGNLSMSSMDQYQSKVNITNSIDYVYLAKASCSSSGSGCNDTTNINMKLISSAGSSFSADFDDNPADNNGGKGFKCRVCDRHFKQKGNLKTHLMTHSGERPHECSTCGKIFTQKGNLDTHVKIHTETKDHKCAFCDRCFTQRGNLKTHIRSVHTKEKPFACGVCGKAFSQKGNMLTHFRTHDKNARFPCNVCGKTFSQKGNLKTHQQRHGRRPGR